MLDFLVRTTCMARACMLGTSKHTQHAYLYGDQVQNSGDRSLATRLPVGRQDLQVFFISELHPVADTRKGCCNSFIIMCKEECHAASVA